MGNCTVVFDDDGVPRSYGNRKVSRATITLSASYAAGGDTIPAWAQAGNLSSLLRARVIDHGNHGYKLALDSRTIPTKVKAFRSGAALGDPFAEAAAATNLSAVDCIVEFEGY